MLIKCASMIRHLLLGLAVICSVSAIDVYADDNLQPIDDNRKLGCQSLVDRLETAYEAEDWHVAARVSGRILECERDDSTHANATISEMTVWHVRALYRAGSNEDALRVIGGATSSRGGSASSHGTSSVNDVAKGELLYYGYLAASRLGQDDRALDYVEAAQRYSADLSAETRAKITVSRMHAASNAGQYQVGLRATETARQLLSNPAVHNTQRARIHRAEAVLRLYHVMDRQDEGAMGLDYDQIRELLQRAESLYPSTDDASIAYLRAAHAVVFALEGSDNVAEATAQRAIDRAERSQTDWSVGYANLLAARVSVLASDGETALARLDRAEAVLARRGNSAQAEIEELRVRAHAVNERYDRALVSMWKLRTMEAPGAQHRMQMASVATVGSGGFLPWGIATALLCLASGVVATHLPRWLRAALLPSGFTTPWAVSPSRPGNADADSPAPASASPENVLQS